MTRPLNDQTKTLPSADEGVPCMPRLLRQFSVVSKRRNQRGRFRWSNEISSHVVVASRFQEASERAFAKTGIRRCSTRSSREARFDDRSGVAARHSCHHGEASRAARGDRIRSRRPLVARRHGASRRAHRACASGLSGRAEKGDRRAAFRESRPSPSGSGIMALPKISQVAQAESEGRRESP